MCAARVQLSKRYKLRTTTALTLVFAITSGPVFADNLLYDTDLGSSGGGSWSDDTAALHWFSRAGDQPVNDLPGDLTGMPAFDDLDFFQNDEDNVFFSTFDVLTVGTTNFVRVATDVKPNAITFVVDGYRIFDPMDAGQKILVDDDGLEIDVITGDAVLLIGLESEAATSGTITVNGNTAFNPDPTGMLILDDDNSESVGLLSVEGGQLKNLGNYGGAVTLDGGDLIAQSGLISGATTVTDGTLRLAGGTFANGAEIDVQAGTTNLVVAADTDVDVATASDVTVNSGVTLQGAIDVTTGGDVMINGIVQDAVTNDGGLVTLNGADVQGGIDNDSGTVTVSGDSTGGTIANSATLNVNAEWDGSITQDGGATTLTDDVTGSITLTGGVLNANGGIVTGAVTVGDVSAIPTAEIIASGTQFNGGLGATAGGTITIDTDTTANVTNNGGTVDIESAATLTGTVSNLAGNTTNNGIVQGNVSLGGDPSDVFANNNQINGTVTLSGGTFDDAAGGSAGVSGTVRNNGGTINHRGGTFDSLIVNNSGTLNLLANTNTEIRNAGGTVDVGTGVVVSGVFVSTDGTTDNAGTINDDLFLSGANTNIINNNATGLLAGDVTIGGDAVVTNATNADIDGFVRVTGGTLNADGGSFQEQIVNVGGTVNVRGLTETDLRNQSGNTVIANTGTLEGEVVVAGGSVTNSGGIEGDATVTAGSLSGTADITGLLFVSGGTVDLNGGQIGSTGDEARFIGGSTNLAGVTFDNGLRAIAGTITMDGDVTGDLVSVGGTTTVNNSQTLTGDVFVNGGTVTANGLIDGNAVLVAGAMNLGGGVQNGAVNAAGGMLAISGGTYDNLVRNAGASATVSGGTFSNGFLNVGASSSTTVSGSTTGNFTNFGGVLNVNAGLDGAVVHNGGTTTQTAQVDQDVTILTGIYNLQAAVDGQTTLNTGSLITNGASFVGGLQALGGQVDLGGVNAGDVTNNGSDIEILAGGRLNGDMRVNSGDFSNRGVLNGSLAMVTGSTTNHSGSNVTGAAVLTGGTLNASGGAFGGGVTLNGGTFNLNANTSGDITNNGLNVTVASGRTLTGDFRNNSGALTHNGRVTGRVVVSGGTASVGANATVTEDFRVNSGVTANVAGGTFGGGIVNGGGTIAIAGTVNGAIVGLSGDTTTDNSASITGNASLSSGATLTHGGDLTGQTSISGGTLTNNGTLDGNVGISNGTLNNRSSGEVTGSISLSGGTMLSRGGDVGGRITNSGGRVVIREDTTIDGIGSNSLGVINSRGTLDIEDTATLISDVRNEANGLIELDGVLRGDLINRGVVNARGELDGGLINTGDFNIIFGNSARALTLEGSSVKISGQFENAGELDISASNLEVGSLLNRDPDSRVLISGGKALVSAGAVDFVAGALRINNGGLEGEMDFGVGVAVNLTNAEMEGQITSGTLIRSSGQTSLASGPRGDGDLTFEGDGLLFVQSGSFDVEGEISTLEATELTVVEGASLSAGSLVSQGVVTLGAGATLETRTLGQNNGTLLFGDGTNIIGDFRNTSLIRGSGTLSFADGLTGGGRINLQQNSATTDRVEIGGNLGNQQFNLDIDLGDDVGQSDQIVMTGDAIITGTVELNFNVLDSGGEQDEDVVVIRASDAQDPNSYTISISGLAGAESDSISIIEYGATINNQGDVVVFDGLSAGVGSLAGNIVLAQSLIGSVINRPSSPFVSGLAFEDEDPCGVGTWARMIGGQADGSGRVEQDNGVAFDGNISANYYGVQVGGDYACFNGFYDGWDLAFGGIVGANFGQSSQPVFALNPSADNGLSDTLLSTTDVDFTQLYGGVYVAAVRDALAVDLQYRVEETEFTATNVSTDGGSALGLTDERFNSSAQTLSGAVSYAYPLPDYDVTIVPTAGFAYTQIETDPITFQNLGVLEISDFDSRTAFVGATVSRTRFGADGVSAITQFGTATVYNDFAESPVSTFTAFDDDNNPTNETFTTTTQNLGLYGELSAGVNYTRILQPGEFGPAKQFNASIRSDIRLSDQLESWGVTAQARIQF